MKLGDLLGLYMKDRGLSYRELAKEIGCDHSTIHRMVSGEPCRMDVTLLLFIWMLGAAKPARK